MNDLSGVFFPEKNEIYMKRRCSAAVTRWILPRQSESHGTLLCRKKVYLFQTLVLSAVETTESKKTQFGSATTEFFQENEQILLLFLSYLSIM